MPENNRAGAILPAGVAAETGGSGVRIWQRGARWRVLAALAEAILADHREMNIGAEAGTDLILVAEMAEFLHDEQNALPHALSAAMKIATFGVELLPLPAHRRRFSQLDLPARVALTRRWRSARLGPLRDFMKFHDIFTLYCYYDAHGGGEVT